jgi:Tol biopolymer transport system component
MGSAIDRLFAQPLAGTEDAQFPFWSPDSSAIAFVARGKLKRVDLSGGPPISLQTLRWQRLARGTRTTSSCSRQRAVRRFIVCPL